MEKYNYLVQLDRLKNYNCGITDNYDQEKAQIIHDNFDKLDGFGKRNLLAKCLSDREVDMYLLRFELINYNDKTHSEQELSLDEFEKKAIQIINRYHWKAGGYKIEDSEWIIHNSDSNSYEVLFNELLFENTIDRSDVKDEETEFFMDHLIKQLSSLSKNIKVEYRYKNRKDKTPRILIWVTDTNIIINSDNESSHESIGL